MFHPGCEIPPTALAGPPNLDRRPSGSNPKRYLQYQYIKTHLAVLTASRPIACKIDLPTAICQGGRLEVFCDMTVRNEYLAWGVRLYRSGQLNLPSTTRDNPRKQLYSNRLLQRYVRPRVPVDYPELEVQIIIVEIEEDYMWNLRLGSRISGN